MARAFPRPTRLEGSLGCPINTSENIADRSPTLDFWSCSNGKAKTLTARELRRVLDSVAIHPHPQRNRLMLLMTH